MTHIPPIRSDYERNAPCALDALAKLADPTESWPSWRALIEQEAREMHIPLDQALSSARAASSLWGMEAAADCLELCVKPFGEDRSRSAELATPSEWASIAVHCAIFGRDPEYTPNPAIRALFATTPIAVAIGKLLANRIRDLDDSPANKATLKALGAIEIGWGVGHPRISEPFAATLKARFMFYDIALIERLLDQATAHTSAALSALESKSISQSIPIDELPVGNAAPRKTL